MQNYVQPGKRVGIYNASSTVTLLAGVPVVVAGGGHIRIPIANILPLSWGEASTEEVFNLPAKSSDTFTDGQTLYWDATNVCLTVTAASNALAGMSVPTDIAGVPTAGKAAGVTNANVAIANHNIDGTITPQAPPTAAAAVTAVATGIATGDTGATAGAFASAAHRDLIVTAVLALITDVTNLQAEVAALQTILAEAGVVT